MMPADKVVGNITIHFCLLKYHDKNWAVVGGYGYYGQTHGVGSWVVGCAFASLLGMEYEQYYIQKCLDQMPLPPVRRHHQIAALGRDP
jgi:hypothetical protein